MDSKTYVCLVYVVCKPSLFSGLDAGYGFRWIKCFQFLIPKTECTWLIKWKDVVQSWLGSEVYMEIWLPVARILVDGI